MGERRLPHLQPDPRSRGPRESAISRRDAPQGGRRRRDDTLSRLSNSPPNRTAWAWTVATFLGIGFLKPGPGTLASLPVALLWLFLGTHHGGASFNLYWVAFSIILTLVGVAASTIVARQSGIEDPSHVVIDEVAGQAIALFAAPVFNWKYALAAFILFRVFDIVKPPPVRQLERLSGGWGIMMDDVAAGVFALVLLQIAARFHLFL